MKRYTIFFASLVFFAVVMIGMAQTRDEFKHKYGPPDAKGRYLVRPDIGFEVKYKQNRTLSEMTIKPLSSENDGSKKVMSSKLAEESLDELVPEKRRGEKTKEGVAEFGCTSVNYTEYELVKINTTKRCSAQGDGTYSINVRWK